MKTLVLYVMFPALMVASAEASPPNNNSSAKPAPSHAAAPAPRSLGGARAPSTGLFNTAKPGISNTFKMPTRSSTSETPYHTNTVSQSNKMGLQDKSKFGSSPTDVHPGEATGFHPGDAHPGDGHFGDAHPGDAHHGEIPYRSAGWKNSWAKGSYGYKDFHSHRFGYRHFYGYGWGGTVIGSYYGGGVYFDLIPSVQVLVAAGPITSDIAVTGQVVGQNPDGSYAFSDGVTTFNVASDQPLPLNTTITVGGVYDGTDLDVESWNIVPGPGATPDSSSNPVSVTTSTSTAPAAPADETVTPVSTVVGSPSQQH